MSDAPRLDWETLIWETQGFLGLDEDEPVPKDELKETVLANGWSERKFETALRATNAVGDPLASNPDLQLAGADDYDEDDTESGNA